MHSLIVLRIEPGFYKVKEGLVTTERSQIRGTSGRAKPIDEVALAPPGADAPSDISALIEPYRRELQLHCYRLLGSVHDAEDLVQETMLRAWLRFDTFKGASSLRTWLYTIATNACLDALKKRPRRTLPVAAFPPVDPHGPLGSTVSEAIWLEPFPDTWLTEAVETPEAHYSRRESISLAFLTALQLLPPRQRAILILMDVLDWRAREVARLLEITTSAVNSALHRARVTLEKNYRRDDREAVLGYRVAGRISSQLARYVQAWETDDIDGLVALLKEDAALSMPPFPAWMRGREAIRAILLHFILFPIEEGFMLPTRWSLHWTKANGQPALALYRADEAAGCYRAFGIQVLTFDEASEDLEIVDVTIFNDPSLFAFFDLPEVQID